MGTSGGDFGCDGPVSGWDRWDMSPKDIPADGPLAAQRLSTHGQWIDWFGSLQSRRSYPQQTGGGGAGTHVLPKATQWEVTEPD